MSTSVELENAPLEPVEHASCFELTSPIGGLTDRMLKERMSEEKNCFERTEVERRTGEHLMQNEPKLIGTSFENVEIVEELIVKRVHPIRFDAEHQSTVHDIRDEGALERSIDFDLLSH